MPKDVRKKKTSHINKVKRKVKNNKQTERLSSSEHNVNEQLSDTGEVSEVFRSNNNTLQPLQANNLTLENRLDAESHSSNNTSFQFGLHNSNNINRDISDLYINRLYNSLHYSEEVTSMMLPNRSWAIHCTDIPVKRIVVGQLVLYNLHGRGFEPFYVKQIIFDEKLNFELFLMNSRAVLKEKLPYIRSLNDFESLMDYVNSLKICTGGPDFSKYNKVTLECAYRDQFNKWRHNLCTLEVNDGDTCESCVSLEEILKRHAQRINSPLKSRNCVVVAKRKKLGHSRDS